MVLVQFYIKPPLIIGKSIQYPTQLNGRYKAKVVQFIWDDTDATDEQFRLIGVKSSCFQFIETCTGDVSLPRQLLFPTRSVNAQHFASPMEFTLHANSWVDLEITSNPEDETLLEANFKYAVLTLDVEPLDARQ